MIYIEFHTAYTTVNDVTIIRRLQSDIIANQSRHHPNT